MLNLQAWGDVESRVSNKILALPCRRRGSMGFVSQVLPNSRKVTECVRRIVILLANSIKANRCTLENFRINNKRLSSVSEKNSPWE